MNVLENLAVGLNRRYLKSLVRDTNALRFFLNNAADAESNGEGAVFDRVKPFVDGSLARIIERHASDEVRHAQILTDALASIGGTRTEPPAALRMVERTGEAAGDVWNKPLEKREDAAKVYLLLYAIERRAIERFTLMEEALRPVYPEIADVFARIKKDERAHLHYCAAVSRACVADDAAWTTLRDEMIELEAREFTTQSKAFMFHLLDNVFTTMPWYEKAFWKGARALRDMTGRPDYVLDVGGARDLPGARASAPVAMAA